MEFSENGRKAKDDLQNINRKLKDYKSTTSFHYFMAL